MGNPDSRLIESLKAAGLLDFNLVCCAVYPNQYVEQNSAAFPESNADFGVNFLG